MDKLLHLETKLAYLEAERARLLARLAALEGTIPRGGGEGRAVHPTGRRAALERLHGLLSTVWLELQEAHPQRVSEIEEALRILEELLLA